MGEIVMYDRKPTEDAREVFNHDIHTSYYPLFAFAHGLSFAKFEMGDILLSSTIIKRNEKLNISVSVKNAGKPAGKHTIELYTRDLYASVGPKLKRLRVL